MNEAILRKLVFLLLGLTMVLSVQSGSAMYCNNQPYDYIDPTGGKPIPIAEFDATGNADINSSARVLNGVPQVQYGDWQNWWGPILGGSQTRWWQSPTDPELARLFRPTDGGYRLATTDERMAVWNQQMAVALPTAMVDAQNSFNAFAKLSGGGIAASTGIGTLYMGGTGGLVIAGHEFYAAGSNWISAITGRDLPLSPEGAMVQGMGAPDSVVAGTDFAALPLLGTFRFGPTTLYRGVPVGTPRYQAALQGIVAPRGTALDPLSLRMHVLGEDVSSGVTSWTPDRAIAQQFAGPNGIVLEVPFSRVAGQVVPRPFVGGKYNSESEILLRGLIKIP